MVGTVTMVKRLFSLRGMSWREVPPMIMLALCALWVFERTRQYERDHAPVVDYFDVRQIAVPDHPQGVDPHIVYDRKINRDFDATWIVQIQSLDQNLKDVCVGSAHQHYFKDKRLPDTGVTLAWVVGHECHLPTGSYRLVACWDIHRVRAINVETCYITQPFTVFESKEEIQ